MLRRNWVTFLIPLVLLLGVALIPYIWILLASFKKRVDLITPDPKWVFEPTVVNYVEIFGKGFDRFLLNSIVIGFSSTALTVIVGTLAAYGFSRFKDSCGKSSLLPDTRNPARAAGCLRPADVPGV